jgi:hypothetical protein
MIDKERVIAEVSIRNGIRIGKHDPLFAVMTVAQLALEESVQDLETRLGAIVAEFEMNVRAVERRAGKVLAQEVKDCASEMRTCILDDINAAGVKARELVQSVHEAHRRPTTIGWISVGLLCGLALLICGIWFGRLTASR